MSLELYETYTSRVSLDACEGDALGALDPSRLEAKLQALQVVAEEGYVDGWMDYIDPHRTYEENESILRDVAGVTNTVCVTCGVTGNPGHDHGQEGPHRSVEIE